MQAPYGSDKNGLICGFLFESGGPGIHIDLDRALNWLSAPQAAAEGSFVWLHFNLSDAAAEAWIRGHLGVVPEFFEALHVLRCLLSSVRHGMAPTSGCRGCTC